MSTDKNNISIFIISFLLSALILLPLGIKFEHLFENHNHVSCLDSTTHFHKKSIECNLDSFSFSTFNIEFNTYSFSEEILPFSNKNYHYEIHHIISDERFIKLRGPPKVTTLS